MYSRIKEFGDLVTQANRTGAKEIKLDRRVAVELLSEITKILLDRLEQVDSTTTQATTTQTLSGGTFTE